MALFESGNPTLSEKQFQQTVFVGSDQTMTVRGTMNKFGFLMLMVMAFSLIRIVPNLVYHSKLRPTRYSLGMVYPSVIAAHYLFLALAYCYLMKL